MKRLLSLVTALLFTVTPLAGCANEASIGVIGGADGPTHLMVSTPNDGGQAALEDSLNSPPDDVSGIDDINDFSSATGSGDSSKNEQDDSRSPSFEADSPRSAEADFATADASTNDTASSPFDLSEYEAITGVETLILGDSVLDEEGWYSTKEEVALYLMQYNQLPGNYITKKEAREMGWEGGSLDDYAPGYSIGGDRFGNYEGALPEGHTYTECDINTQNQKSRGAKRIVFSNDGLIFYTEDHYSTFTLLAGDE